MTTELPLPPELDAVHDTALAAADAIAARDAAIRAARAAGISLRRIADATDGHLTHTSIANIVARTAGDT